MILYVQAHDPEGIRKGCTDHWYAGAFSILAWIHFQRGSVQNSGIPFPTAWSNPKGSTMFGPY